MQFIVCRVWLFFSCGCFCLIIKNTRSQVVPPWIEEEVKVVSVEPILAKPTTSAGSPYNGNISEYLEVPCVVLQ